MADYRLRSLSGDSGVDLERLLQSWTADDIALADVRNFLTDPISVARKRAFVENVTDEASAAHPAAATNAALRQRLERVRAHLAFVRLLLLIEDMVDEGVAEPNPAGVDAAEANGLLMRMGADDVLARFYALDRMKLAFDFEEAQLYAIGTTSFIIKCRAETRDGDRSIALKCLRPRFFANQSVAEAMESYPRDYDFADSYAPSAYGATTTAVAMEFIEGDTLTKVVSREIASGSTGWSVLGPQRRTFLLEVLEQLVPDLLRLAANDKHHYDLSLDNVIRRPSRELTLVDFGMNNLARVGFVSSRAADRAKSYLAVDAAGSGLGADSRALGLIVLEVLTRGRTEAVGGFVEEPIDVEGGLALLWEQAPGVARLVESVVFDPDPTPLDGIVAAFKVQFDELANLAPLQRAATSRLADLRQLLRPERLKQLARAAKDPVASESRRARYLLRHGRWASWAMWLLVVVFLAQCSYDFGFDHHSAALLRWSFPGGRAVDHLILRCASLSVAAIAYAYYINIFATVTVDDVALPDRVKIEWWMRYPAIIAIALQIPTMRWTWLWGLTTAVGGLLVAYTNRVAAKLVEEIGARAAVSPRATILRSGAAVESFKRRFGDWAENLMTYSLGVLVVWALCTAHVTKDVYIYALVVIVIDVMRVYKQNCWKDAPEFRAMLARGTEFLRAELGPPAVAAGRWSRGVALARGR